MKTIQNKGRPTFMEQEKNSLVVRLERNQNDVKQLRAKLNSYSCEPQTYGLFERIEALKNGLDNFSRTNKEILASLKEHKKSAMDNLDRIRQQYTEFNNLQQGVEEYLGLARNKYTPI